MPTLFEGCFWCFFLEKKDILRDFEPKNSGTIGERGNYGGGSRPYCRFRWLLSCGKWVGGDEESWYNCCNEFKLTQSRIDRQTPKFILLELERERERGGATAGFELFGRRRLCFTFRTRLLTILQGRSCLENRRKDTGDSGYMIDHASLRSPQYRHMCPFNPIRPPLQASAETRHKFKARLIGQRFFHDATKEIVHCSQTVSQPPASPASRLKHLAEDTHQQQPASPFHPSSGPASPIPRWFQSQLSSSSPPPTSRPQNPHSAALSEAMHDHPLKRPEPVHLPP